MVHTGPEEIVGRFGFVGDISIQLLLSIIEVEARLRGLASKIIQMSSLQFWVISLCLLKLTFFSFWNLIIFLMLESSKGMDPHT